MGRDHVLLLSIVPHSVGSYDGAFFAFYCYQGTRQEALRAWSAENYEYAFQQLVICQWWWEQFLFRRARVRKELRGSSSPPSLKTVLAVVTPPGIAPQPTE